MHDSGWEKFSKIVVIAKCIVLSGLWKLTTHDAPGKASLHLTSPAATTTAPTPPGLGLSPTHCSGSSCPTDDIFPWHQPVAGNLIFLCGPNWFSPAAIWREHFSRTRWNYSFVEFRVKIFTKGKLNMRHFRNTFLWLLHIVLSLPHHSQDWSCQCFRIGICINSWNDNDNDNGGNWVVSTE